MLTPPSSAFSSAKTKTMWRLELGQLSRAIL